MTEIGFPSNLGQNTYEVDYYGGSQVLVYFQDVLVDDVIRIGWSVRQEFH